MAKHSSISILVVDDEPIIRESLGEFLEQQGFHVTLCETAEKALAFAQQERVDVAVCDVHLPAMDGLTLLDRLLKISPEMFVLLMTAFGTVDSAVQAFQRGAHDYLMKPILFDDVLYKINRYLAYRELSRENQWLRRELSRQEQEHQIIGSSLEMRRVMEVTAKVAPTPSTVLIIGESGTGKELVARAIHRQSPAHSQRFLAVNCAAIPHELLENQLFGRRKGAFTGADRDQDGVFVHAGEGTVFLDEIAELPLATQAKLLRALEQKEILPVGANEPISFDARIIAATNKDLTKEVAEGRFREDLYYRLNVVSIRIPPLRERREDIPDLVEYLLAQHAQSLKKRFTGVTHEAMQILMTCPWKGNVRELDNALQRAAILGDGPLVTPMDLPPDLRPDADAVGHVENLSEAVRQFEKRHISKMLHRTADKKEAAERLGVALSSLYRKIAELGI